MKIFNLLIVILVFWCSCTHGPRRFPLADPLWVDCDQNHVPNKPEKFEAMTDANSVDKPILRPLAKLFTFPLPGEAQNVNSMDEVPNSSWFTNRIGLLDMTPEETARGRCQGPPLDPEKGPWIINAAKTAGATPGFFVETPSGRYLLKFDGPIQPQRATAADTIGSKIYHAAGYNVPCNQIVYFRRDILKIGKGAKAKNECGEKYPVTRKEIDQVLRMAFRLKDGRIRAVASKFLPGKPIGTWEYEGTRSDDPNDVVPHEDRRELRGVYLLAAWINHWDDREGNTLNLWMNQGGRSFLRHFYIDFGDCFGYRAGVRSDAWSRRSGFSHNTDLEHVLLDLVSLGMIPRPWYRAKITNQAEIFGYFSSRDFVPSQYRTKRPNVAFSRMTPSDALWMVRIISRFSDEHVRAMVKTGQFLDPAAEDYLTRTLIERRDRILEEYLTRHAPLDRFRLVRRRQGDPVQSLCFEDLAIRHRVVSFENVVYKFRFVAGQGLERELGCLQFRPDPDHPHRSCVQLPIGDQRPDDLAPDGAPDDHPLRYGVLRIFIHQKPSLPPTSSMWLHFYDLGPERGYRLVGIERQPEPVMPDLY